MKNQWKIKRRIRVQEKDTIGEDRKEGKQREETEDMEIRVSITQLWILKFTTYCIYTTWG